MYHAPPRGRHRDTDGRVTFSLTADERAEARALRSAGISVREIARRLGVSHATISRATYEPDPEPEPPAAPEPDPYADFRALDGSILYDED
jgi:DNA invertase Pin-like site-specific DNA recombinase